MFADAARTLVVRITLTLGERASAPRPPAEEPAPELEPAPALAQEQVRRESLATLSHRHTRLLSSAASISLSTAQPIQSLREKRL